jgi:Fe-Mn family superoxide dismutase
MADAGHSSEEIRMNTTRRESLALSAAVLAAPLSSLAQTPQEGRAQPSPSSQGSGKHQIQPLPFDPRKLKGLSERLLVSHHENNYGGALKNLNKVEIDLAATTKDMPGYQISGLRERELIFTNSVILHEHYFGSLGGNGRASGAIEKGLAGSFGSFARFEELFRSTGMSLAGGSGWTLLDLSFQTGDLRVYWSGNHSQALAFGAPLLVLDMYEHAYHIDYGAAATKYVDAFFANVNWDEVNRRHERARKALAALRAS